MKTFFDLFPAFFTSPWALGISITCVIVGWPLRRWARVQKSRVNISGESRGAIDVDLRADGKQTAKQTSSIKISGKSYAPITVRSTVSDEAGQSSTNATKETLI